MLFCIACSGSPKNVLLWGWYKLKAREVVARAQGARLGDWNKAGGLEQGWGTGTRLEDWNKAGGLEQGLGTGTRLEDWNKARGLEQG